ncbi:hypothetical protein GCM10022204_26520 [Microlunatus aurantiacus]|uniref:Uncharacterized protein n=1 Tax=Microlunatus aurantiacus TaxID=446786 RepID=A0ABP7DPZ4_9ACTN
MLHLTATIRRPDNDELEQVEVDADTYERARQAVHEQLGDGWIVTAYRVDRPLTAS